MTVSEIKDWLTELKVSSGICANSKYHIAGVDCEGRCIEAIDFAIKCIDITMQIVDGCKECMFEKWERPCSECKRSKKDYWRKKA